MRGYGKRIIIPVLVTTPRMAKKEYTTINRGNENFSWASFKVDCDKRLGQAVNHFPILCLAVKGDVRTRKRDAVIL